MSTLVAYLSAEGRTATILISYGCGPDGASVFDFVQERS